MNYSTYKTMKAASKSSVSKEKKVTVPELKDSDGNVVQAKEEIDVIYLVEKRYNPSTGEEMSDSKIELDIDHLKTDKASLESDKASLESTIENLTQLITDVEAL
tara:strand:- start:211 stop:522 length:312 start_codon:yes stop_codon:yes gene_type:complete